MIRSPFLAAVLDAQSPDSPFAAAVARQQSRLLGRHCRHSTAGITGVVVDVAWDSGLLIVVAVHLVDGVKVRAPARLLDPHPVGATR